DDTVWNTCPVGRPSAKRWWPPSAFLLPIPALWQVASGIGKPWSCHLRNERRQPAIRRRSARQLQPETGAGAGAVVEAEVAAMGDHDLARDRQAQPGAAGA